MSTDVNFVVVIKHAKPCHVGILDLNLQIQLARLLPTYIYPISFPLRFPDINLKVVFLSRVWWESSGKVF